MSDHRIIKGDSMPGKGRGRPGAYPFPKMKVGDSFIAERKAVSAACVWGKRHGVKFASRKQPDGSIQIWRVL